jgi:hypothetical protein
VLPTEVPQTSADFVPHAEGTSKEETLKTVLGDGRGRDKEDRQERRQERGDREEMRRPGEKKGWGETWMRDGDDRRERGDEE